MRGFHRKPSVLPVYPACLGPKRDMLRRAAELTYTFFIVLDSGGLRSSGGNKQLRNRCARATGRTQTVKHQPRSEIAPHSPSQTLARNGRAANPPSGASIELLHHSSTARGVRYGIPKAVAVVAMVSICVRDPPWSLRVSCGTQPSLHPRKYLGLVAVRSKRSPCTAATSLFGARS